MGYNPAIILRGYRGSFSGTKLVDSETTAQQVGDEAIFHYRRGFNVVVDRDRARALSFIERNTDSDIVISDDGLQHFNLRRNFEIVVEDSSRDFGNRLFLPAGPLRDNISRKDQVDIFLHSGRAKNSKYFFELEPDSWVNLATGKSYQIDEFPFGKNVNVVSGIANPVRFLETLNAIKINYDFKLFSDHHFFTNKDLEFEYQRPLIMTEKDAVRISSGEVNESIWYLKMRVKLNINLTKIIKEKINEQ